MKFKYLFIHQAVTTPTPSHSPPPTSFFFSIYFVRYIHHGYHCFQYHSSPYLKGTENILYFQTREQTNTFFIVILFFTRTFMFESATWLVICRDWNLDSWRCFYSVDFKQIVTKHNLKDVYYNVIPSHQ